MEKFMFNHPSIQFSNVDGKYVYIYIHMDLENWMILGIIQNGLGIGWLFWCCPKSIIQRSRCHRDSGAPQFLKILKCEHWDAAFLGDVWSYTSEYVSLSSRGSLHEIDQVSVEAKCLVNRVERGVPEIQQSSIFGDFWTSKSMLKPGRKLGEFTSPIFGRNSPQFDTYNAPQIQAQLPTQLQRCQEVPGITGVDCRQVPKADKQSMVLFVHSRYDIHVCFCIYIYMCIYT